MKFCNLGEKNLMVSNFKSKLNSKFMAKESKTIKITIVIRNGKIVWKHGPYLAEL